MQAAWEFVVTLLASPGLAVFVTGNDKTDVVEEVILEALHIAGNLCPVTAPFIARVIKRRAGQHLSPTFAQTLDA
jgi:hypothetical protein